MLSEDECTCSCHRYPATMHIVACCEPYLGKGSPHFCEHANECPQSCPCEDPECYCKGRTCAPVRPEAL